MKTRTVAIGGLWIAGLAVGASAADATEALVLELSGQWCVWANGACERSLRLGDELAGGAAVRPSGGTRAEQRTFYFWTVLRDGRYFGLSCAAAGSCEAPVTIPRSKPKPAGAAVRIWTAVRQLFVPRPDKYYSSALSRGGEPCGLKEGVAASGPAGLDLSAVVLPRGNDPCVLQLDGLTPQGDPVPGTAQVLTVPPATLAVSANVPPGLYVLEVLDTDTRPAQLSGTFAWVKVVSPAMREAVARDFCAAERLTQAWPDATPTARRTFLRAFLASLSDTR